MVAEYVSLTSLSEVLFNTYTEPHFVVLSSYGHRVRGGVRNYMALVLLLLVSQWGSFAHILDVELRCKVLEVE